MRVRTPVTIAHVDDVAEWSKLLGTTRGTGLGTSLRAWVRTPPSSLEFHAARSYPWPSWSKALDLSLNLSGDVGSNPTGCTHLTDDGFAIQIPVLRVNRVSDTS